MARYIFKDNSGNIIRTEDKGRGRPKVGAVLDQNGDYVIVEGEIPSVVLKTPIAIKTNTIAPVINNSSNLSPVEAQEEEIEAPVRALTKHITHSGEKYNIKHFLDKFHTSAGDAKENDEMFDFRRPDQLCTDVEFGVNGFSWSYAIFNRIQILKGSGDMIVWGLNSKEYPALHIHGVFKDI
jgi:hypothetical protein